GNRQRSGAVPGSARTTKGGGNQGAGGEHALAGIVRRPAPGIPGPCASARRGSASLRGASLDVRLGPVRWRHGPEYRHAFLWRVGPAERIGEGVRLYAGAGGGGHQGPAAPIAPTSAGEPFP